MQTEIVIKCPKCSEKALFKSVLTGDSYVKYPERKGIAICKHCGYNSVISFTQELYYYKIIIDNNTLFARSLDNLILIRDHLQYGIKNTEPDTDFPKWFYENKVEVIRKINALLALEK